jgi:coenzyme F420-0:L-glutamate ligase / coenzyme F420-1:gamma-L-glutamate ligase
MMSQTQSPVPYWEWLSARRSIRSFRKEPVSPEILDRIIAAACMSPSAHNLQPWRFAVFQALAGRVRLAEIMTAHMRQMMEADGKDGLSIARRTERTMRRFSEAPAVTMVFCEFPQPGTVLKASDQAEKTLIIQSVASAIGYLLLAAQGEGLGSCWIGYPAFCPAEIFSEFGLPLTWEPQAAVLIGSPDEQPEAPERLPKDRIRKMVG